MIKNRGEKLIAIGALVLILALLPTFAVACGNGEDEEPGATPTPGMTGDEPRIYFYEDSADVGKVAPGDSVEYTFHFKNVGDAPLIIEDAQTRVLEGC